MEGSVKCGRKIIRTVNHLKKETGRLGKKEKAEVVAVLRRFIGEIRGFFEKDSPLFYQAFPEEKRPCATCALNPKLDGLKGFPATTYGLMRAIRDDKAPFICHSNQPGWKSGRIDTTKLKVCGGFLPVMCVSPEIVRESALRADKDIQEIVQRSRTRRV